MYIWKFLRELILKVLTRKKIVHYVLWLMLTTYCGDHVTIYLSNYYAVYLIPIQCQLYLNKTGRKFLSKDSF